MLDEAHDCTACQVDVVARAPCRRLVVYDDHQAIYQFRHAYGLRVLRALPAVATRPLTQACRQT